MGKICCTIRNQGKNKNNKKIGFPITSRTLKEGSLGFSLLHSTCTNNPVIPLYLIPLFLSAGVNPNFIDVDGFTPLHLLAVNVNADNISAALKLLLRCTVR